MVRVIKAGMAGVNRIVFRQTGETMSGQELARRLLSVISKISRFDAGSILDALVVAGEAECALSDCGWASAAKAAEITDIVSAAFVGSDFDEERLQALSHGLANHSPEAVGISHPEGFAYYALHPGDFADAMVDVDCRAPVAVVGIRSVGTTLSAVACAALRKRGVRAIRITVRPAGHPYGRTTELNDGQRVWVRTERRDGSRFMVVDEGPGLSGSSFVSVAESLMREGVGAESITLLGTRDVDPAQLCTANAVSRWKRFGWRRVSSRISERFKHSTSFIGRKWMGRSIGPRIRSMCSSLRVWEIWGGKSASVPELSMRLDSVHGWTLLAMACPAMSSFRDELSIAPPCRRWCWTALPSTAYFELVNSAVTALLMGSLKKWCGSICRRKLGETGRLGRRAFEQIIA